MNRRLRQVTLAGAVVLALMLPTAARAQGPSSTDTADGGSSTDEKTAAAATTATAQADDEDIVFRPAEPDFTLVGLPTTLPLGKFKSAFRVTHRFLRPLGQGDFGDLAADLFGIDSGARIGLEYRFGIVPHGEIGIHRTSDRTIEFFSRYEVVKQGRRLPVGVSAWASIEGTNNFKDSYSPSLGALISYSAAEHVAVYVEPIWVNNTNPLPKQVVDHNDTFMVGLGARVRVRPTVYVVGEAAPRAAGYKPDITHGSFAIEKHVGGHMFQLNFSDAFGTTMAQIARGGPPKIGTTHGRDWYMGFNISRKFY